MSLAGRGDGRSQSESLIWVGGDELLNISQELPREDVSYSAGSLSSDGTVAAFSARYFAPLNNIRRTSTNRDIWVWENGTVEMVPHLDPGYEVVMRLSAISGNGEAVIGTAQGYWRALGAFDEPLSDVDNPYEKIYGPDLAWIWTRSNGTQQIQDSRFESLQVTSIDADASVVLGVGRLVDGSDRSFLWFRDQKVVLLDDLFHTLNINIDADWYGFNQISDDGTKLSGLASVDGRYHAIIVTIPDFTP